MSASTTLCDAACHVLSAPDPAEKVNLTHAAAAAWQDGAISEIGATRPPDRPARPPRPELRPPKDMPRRKTSGPGGRIAMLHAIAHIELNAIDLAWDVVARFPDEDMPRAFFDDFVSVADDEARHYSMLANRLVALGSHYGALPAHDGLWEAAERTADDLLARLAVVPMVLEARGLDTAPVTAEKLDAAGDGDSADILRIIGDEEVGHVAAGVKWFEFVCARRGLAPEPAFHALVRERFRGTLKPPFDAEAREKAGMPPAYYAPLTAG